VRLFVALEISDEIRRALAEIIKRLEGVARGARWVRVEGIHVTLKFIGETPAEKVPAIEEALAGVRSDARVEAHFRGAGFFPNDRHPRVFWIGVDASPNLAELAAAVDGRLTKLGIEAETREFKPHLTLARFKGEDGLPLLREAVLKLEPLDIGTMRASEFHLFRSELLPGGARYTRLASFPFVEGQ
jgi:2'-5' RNA ligase